MAVQQVKARSRRTNYNLILRRIHKWLALLVGLQLIMWTLSGFIMSSVPIEEVHGDHLWDKSAKATEIKANDVAFGISDVMERYGAEGIANIMLFTRDGQAAYEVRLKDKIIYLDARNGSLLAPVSEQQAVKIADKAYLGQGKFLSIENVTDEGQYGEIRGRPLPIWKVNFDDEINTSLYVSPDLAKVITVRSDIWRQYDFFWMLHIMDYDTREDFNSPLLVFAASVALFVAFSGLILVFYAFSKKDFRWIKRRKKAI